DERHALLAAVLAGRGRQRGVLDAVPPEAGLVAVALVHPLDAQPLLLGHTVGARVRVPVGQRPVARAVVLAVVGADTEVVHPALQLAAQADLAGDAGAGGRAEGPVGVRHRLGG